MTFNKTGRSKVVGEEFAEQRFNSRSRMNLADWDYEADLVLLRAKLRQASGEEKDELRNLIQQALNLNGNIGGSVPKKVRVSGNKTLNDDSNLNSSLTEKTVWLVNQFQKHFQQATSLNEARLGSHSSKKEITWEDLQLAWTTFEPYFKAVLSTSKGSNPFKIDVIIREVLQYLPRNDLLKCRLINKTWNQNAIQVYYKNPDHVCSVKDLTKFSADTGLALSVPLSIFKRIDISLENNKVEDLITFFSKVGAQIKDLKISESYPCRNEKLKCFCFEYQLKLRMVFQNVPELESLSLSNLPESVVSQPFVLTCDELKTACNRNVHTLAVSMKQGPDFCKEFIDGLLSMVPNIKKYTDFGFDLSKGQGLLTTATFNLSLHSFLLKGNLTVSAKYFCAKMKDQKLKKLEVQLILEDEDDIKYCEVFFASQSETLERMTVGVSNKHNPDVKLKLPFMKTLNRMELKYMHNGDSCLQPFQSKNIPCLCRLKMNRLVSMHKFLENDEFYSVQELVFDYFGPGFANRPYNVELLRRIGTTFPNLRKLNIQSIVLRDNGFPVVFSLSQLEDLRLTIYNEHLENNINYTLSGLPVESAWIISQLIASKSPLISSLERTQASLQTMKCLKRLVLEFSSRDHLNPFVIDEVSVHFGFLSMPPLQQLNILGDFRIYEDGAAELKKFHYRVAIAPNPVEDTP